MLTYDPIEQPNPDEPKTCAKITGALVCFGAFCTVVILIILHLEKEI